MPSRPVVVVIAGPNGSGKTGLSENLLSDDWFPAESWINPDVIAQNEFGGWNDRESIIRAANRARDIREERLLNGDHIVFETVLSVGDKVDFLRRAKAAGYFVHMLFVGTKDPRINASRVANRVIMGGHDVPIAKIVSRYSKSIANGAVVASFANCTHIFDNSDELAAPRLVAHLVDGSLAFKCGDALPSWATLLVGDALSCQTDARPARFGRTPWMR